MEQGSNSNSSCYRSLILRHLPIHADVLICVIVDVALALHLVVAAAFWWVSPKGFPFEHGRFWTNSVIPIAAVFVAGCGLAGIHYQRFRLASVSVLCLAAAWGGAAVAGWVYFPVSVGAVSLLGLIVAVAGVTLALWLMRGEDGFIRWWLPCAVCGALVGVLVVRSQRAPPASTRPINEARAESGMPDTLPNTSGHATDRAEFILTPRALRCHSHTGMFVFSVRRCSNSTASRRTGFGRYSHRGERNLHDDAT
jgi:hypothetical protein